MFQEWQFALGFSPWYQIPKKRIVYKNIIVDRKSKYSVVWQYIVSDSEAREFLKELKKDAFFRKADHNSRAYRLQSETWLVLESKNDDGETWAGMCILRELQRENALNMILVVTRYFGGIHLHTDRFKNVIDACKIFFQKSQE